MHHAAAAAAAADVADDHEDDDDDALRFVIWKQWPREDRGFNVSRNASVVRPNAESLPTNNRIGFASETTPLTCDNGTKCTVSALLHTFNGRA